MSFTTSIAGNAPPNTFVYTTTTVSVDNVSVTNLSATNASIDNLTTLVFTPVNVNASNVYALQADILTLNSSTVNSSTINASTTTTSALFGNAATINAITSGYVTSTDVEAVDINVSNINSSTILSGDVGTTTFNCFDGEAVTFNVSNLSATNLSAGITTVTTADIVIANISSLVSVNASIDVLTFPETTGDPTQESHVMRDANTLRFVGKKLSTDVGIDYTWYTNEGTGQPKLKIASGSDYVDVRSLHATANVSADTGTYSYIETDQLYSPDASFINTTSETDTTDKLLVRHATGLGYEYSYMDRTATTLQVVGKNISTDPDVDLAFYTGEATGTPKIFVAANTSAVDMGALNASVVNASSGNFPILNTTTINTQYANSSVYNTSTLNASAIYGDGLITTFGNMSCVQLEGDISANLAAGTNITLTTTLGVTTINSVGGTVDPLNISVGNISTLSISDGSCDGTLTTANLVAGNLDAFNSNMSYLNVSTINADAINGFIKSTQYAFQVTSNAGSVPFSTGALLPFNVVEFCYPSAGAFNTTSGNFSYTCQVDGVHSIGFHLYLTNPSADTGFEIALFKNNVKFASGGSKAGFTEDVECLASCVAGDVWTVKIVTVSGSPQIFMSATNSWFYGYLLEPTNVAITSTSDLTVLSLNTPTANVSTLNCSTGAFTDISSQNLSVNNVSTYNMTSYAQSASYYYAPSDNLAYAPATIFKTANILRLNGGNTAVGPGYIHLSVDNVSFPVQFNGNLNVATTANVSTANISTINVSTFGTTNNLVGKSANYGRQRTTQQDPPNTDTVVYYDFTDESYANAELFTYSLPSGSAATGFRCRKAGWYRFSYSIYVLSRFGTRVQWRGRTRINNADSIADSFCYTRGADYQYAWEGNCASGGLLELAVDDYLKIEFQVAKNDSSYGDNFEWLFFGPSSSISFEYLGT